MQAQGPLIPSSFTTEVNNGTEMGIGMVMPPYDLPPLTDHRPATLEMQIHLVAIKSSGLEVVPHPSHHLVGQSAEIRMVMQLPNTIQITCPGTTGIWIAVLITSQSQQCLQLRRHLQRIHPQLLRGHDGREKRVQIHKHAPALIASSPHRRPKSSLARATH